MKYKLSIGDYKGMIGFSIKSILIFILILITIFFLTNQLIPGIQILQYIFLLCFICFVIILIIGLKRHFTKEEIGLESEFLSSQHYGRISYEKIRRYRLQKFRGFTSLIISMKDGQKFTIGPRNNFSFEADKEFENFIEEFRKTKTNSS